MHDQSPQERLWHRLGNAEPQEAVSIKLFDFSPKRAVGAKGILEKHGISISETSDATGICVITESLGDDRIRLINQEAWDTDKPLILLKPTGVDIQIAILQTPRACWQCFSKRQDLLDPTASYLKHNLDLDKPIVELPAFTDITVGFALHWMMCILERLSMSKNPELTMSRLYTFNLRTLEMATHEIVKLPYCTCCDTTHVQQHPKPFAIRLDQNMLQD